MLDGARCYTVEMEGDVSADLLLLFLVDLHLVFSFDWLILCGQVLQDLRSVHYLPVVELPEDFSAPDELVLIELPRLFHLEDRGEGHAG